MKPPLSRWRPRFAAALACGMMATFLGAACHRVGDVGPGGDGGGPGDGAGAEPTVEPIAPLSPNLPVVWLQTDDPVTWASAAALPEEKAPGTIRVVDTHDGTHANPLIFGSASMPASLEGKLGIGPRGTSSRQYAQKSFALELRGSDGVSNRKAAVLGMPAAADWALVACWNDKTCLRNALAYWVARATGRWHPRLAFVEVYYNKQYLGLYQLAEVPRQDRNRIAVPEPAADPASGDVSGGYVFRREAGGRGPGRDFQSPVESPPIPGQGSIPAARFAGQKTIYTYHQPNATALTAAQKTYLHQYVASFEAALAGSDWAARYRSLIDVTSWADFWIVNELSGNVDAYWKSMYLTKERDPMPGVPGQLVQAPVWDFNIAFGNAYYRDGYRLDAWVWRMNRFGGECTKYPLAQPLPSACGGVCAEGKTCFNIPYVPFWMERIISDPAFRADVRCRWQALRSEVIVADVIDARLDAWAAALRAQAVTRHLGKWPELKQPQEPNPCGDGYRQPGFPTLVYPNCGSPTASAVDYFDQEVKVLKSWVRNRIEWLDKNIPGKCQ